MRNPEPELLVPLLVTFCLKPANTGMAHSLLESKASEVLKDPLFAFLVLSEIEDGRNLCDRVRHHFVCGLMQEP